ncbi:uncharacterized protein DDB_G0284459 [Drosophila erecta]|uniref:uncharacterized protein DDB_G0284459 n=1 Tax=Drosophila erecta TaxID=7220 RepID=UPI000F048172|nr:uncharacterized protein DDB_G0284459 [Drosophila erecta]XP_026838926.1 uncharacterized protein DDB_G0284459 [Drosophila erecta]
MFPNNFYTMKNFANPKTIFKSCANNEDYTTQSLQKVAAPTDGNQTVAAAPQSAAVPQSTALTQPAKTQEPAKNAPKKTTPSEPTRQGKKNKKGKKNQKNVPRTPSQTSKSSGSHKESGKNQAKDGKSPGKEAKEKVNDQGKEKEKIKEKEKEKIKEKIREKEKSKQKEKEKEKAKQKEKEKEKQKEKEKEKVQQKEKKPEQRKVQEQSIRSPRDKKNVFEKKLLEEKLIEKKEQEQIVSEQKLLEQKIERQLSEQKLLGTRLEPRIYQVKDDDAVIPFADSPEYLSLSDVSDVSDVSDDDLTTGPEDDEPLEPEDPHHPLNSQWTLWYLENDRTKSWEDMLHEVTSFDTVENFWSLVSHIKPPSDLKVGSDYCLFKKGIRPMWEDEANIHGGRWVISLNKNTKLDLDNFWMDSMLCLIGETCEHSNELCGAVVNIRGKTNKISIWTADGANEAGVLEIGRVLREGLRMDSVYVLKYQLHKDTKVKQGSTVKSIYTL